MKSVSLLETTVSVPPLPSKAAVLLQPDTVNLLAENPPVSWAFSIDTKAKLLPSPRLSRPSDSVKSVSLLETTVSVPPLPSKVAVLLQPDTVNLLAEDPPVSWAFSIDTRVKLLPSPRLSRPSDSVKSVSLLDTTVAMPPPPSKVAVLLQPDTLNLLAEEPLVSWAFSIDRRVKLPPSPWLNRPSESIKSVSLMEMTMSAPSAPSKVAELLQPDTLNLLAEDPPVNWAFSIDTRVKLAPSPRLSSVSVRIKSVSLLDTTVSLPVPPSSFAL